MRILLAPQVLDFVRRLPPEPRARVRRAFRELAKDRGDVKPLEAPLAGYCRLRIGGYRIVSPTESAKPSSALMWAIRYRVYKHLSEEELINYTLPFGQRVHDEHIRAIAAGADIGSVVERLYPEVEDLATLLSDPRSGLPRLEIELKRVLARRCMAAFLGDPFHVGLPLAFIILHDLEIQDLIVLLEAKSTRVKAEEFRPYLLSAAAPPA